MGRGSYNGGSTIIGPGGWGFSPLDPLPPGKRRETQATPKVKSSKPKLDPAKTNTGQKKHDWRAEYLSAVVAAVVRQAEPPRLSKQAPSELVAEVGRCASPAAWARAQVGYESVHKRLEARSKRRVGRGATFVQPKAAEPIETPQPQAAKADLTKRIHELTDAIGFHERKLAELRAELALARRGIQM